MKERLKEIWKETIKKHIRRWKPYPVKSKISIEGINYEYDKT